MRIDDARGRLRRSNWIDLRGRRWRPASMGWSSTIGQISLRMRPLVATSAKRSGRSRMAGRAGELSLGVAYFGNRYPHHARADLAEIAAMGADFVVHTFSEADLRW